MGGVALVAGALTALVTMGRVPAHTGTTAVLIQEPINKNKTLTASSTPNEYFTCDQYGCLHGERALIVECKNAHYIYMYFFYLFAGVRRP